jgi:hypothetical protein
MIDAESISSGVGISIVGSRVESRHGQYGTSKQASSGIIEKRGAAWLGGETSSSSEIGQSLSRSRQTTIVKFFSTYSAFIISHAVSAGPLLSGRDGNVHSL